MIFVWSAVTNTGAAGKVFYSTNGDLKDGAIILQDIASSFRFRAMTGIFCPSKGGADFMNLTLAAEALYRGEKLHSKLQVFTMLGAVAEFWTNVMGQDGIVAIELTIIELETYRTLVNFRKGSEEFGWKFPALFELIVRELQNS